MDHLRSLFARLQPDGIMTENFFPPRSTYEPERDVPDLTGKVALITGSNTGIGLETAQQLVLKNARVYIAARSEEKGLQAVELLNRLVKEKGREGEARYLSLDLADLDSVKEAAEEFRAREERLDLLFCNAGVMACPLDMLTKQGYDLQWGTNVVAHYLLCILLLPSLRRSLHLTNQKPRILHTTSNAHRVAPSPSGIDWRSLHGGSSRDELVNSWWNVRYTWTLYGQSKMGNLMVAELLQRRFGEEVVVSLSVHPGVLKSELQRHMDPLSALILNSLSYPTEMGAYTLLWRATSEEGEEFGGKYLIPWARVGTPDPRASDPETLDELEEWLKREVEPWVEGREGRA